MSGAEGERWRAGGGGGGSMEAIRRVNDIVHTSIALPRPLDAIVDTVEFQRLRNVMQLGAAHHVFPSGNHSRFTHSLGTCHIAQLVMDKLRSDVTLNVTADDVTCVSIAALCHDIGHGPYSHMYDGPFMEAVAENEKDGAERKKKEKWTHETGSKAIVRRVFALPKVARALREHLGGSDDQRYERNLDFIIELISPPEHMLDLAGEWVPRGRGREKSFLFDIVSNVHDGFDVDKFDYVLRDSMLAGFGIRFSKESMLRVVDNIRVLACPRLGIKRICFASKVADELLSLADSRHVLHARVYQHKTVKLIEAMIVKSFVAAEPHIKFRNKKGEGFSLSNIHADLDVFCGVDDSILQMIATSNNPELDTAKSYLRAIAERNLAKRVAYVECSPNQSEKLRNIDKEKHEITNSLQAKLVKLGMAYGVLEDDVYVINRRIYSGLDGYKHPMNEVLVYDNKEAAPVPRRLDEDWLELRASRHTTIISFALYLSRSLNQDTVDALRGEFEKALAGYGIEAKSNEGPSPKKKRVAENNN